MNKFFRYRKWCILWSEIASIGPTLGPPNTRADSYSWSVDWFEVRTKQGLKIIVDPRECKIMEEIQNEWHEILSKQ